MKTEWDYTKLADAYLKRPDYAPAAIDAMLKIMGLQSGRVCDVGAGVAHLTLLLAERGLSVDAVEPNDSMRANGRKRTENMDNVRWFEGTGEHTGRDDGAYDAVTFGSSFNVTDRAAALRESKRILKRGGWFACMWNHRNLDDPIQKKIEEIISGFIPDYGYGTRRENQAEVLNASGLLHDVVHLDGPVLHLQTISDCVEAWRSHATLERQAGDTFSSIIERIQSYLEGLNVDSIEIPYSTNIWVAQLR